MPTTLSELRGEREHWSYSSLNQLLFICSAQWAFQRYFDVKPSGPVPLPLVFGSVFHRVFESIATAKMEGHTVKEKDATDLFDFIFRRQVEEDGDVDFGKEDVESCSGQGRKMVACYLAESNDPHEQVIAVNEPFCLSMCDEYGTIEKPLIGEADAIVQNGSMIVVDIKTAKQRYSASKVENSLQATAMIMGVRRKYPEVEDFRFDVVLKRKTAPAMEQYRTTRNTSDYEKLVALARVAENIVRNEAFFPNDQGFYCGGCRFKESCRKWHKGFNAERRQ